MPLQLTDWITYGYPVGDMLNITEVITNELKRIFFFFAPMACKAISKIINNGLTDKPEITDECFFDRQFPYVISSIK
jgi:hypothetical protein